MKIISPQKLHIPGLRTLWKEAFGDTDEFMDNFFETGFSPDRCLCAMAGDTVAAALYWFRCEYKEKTVAYIYAVATAKNYRGQGLCHELMNYVHEHLTALGYEGAILVPGSKSLFDFYESMGYTACCYHKKIACTLDSNFYTTTLPDFSLSPVTKEKYTLLRRDFLPADSVIQEGENIDFLATQCSFYAGTDFLLAVGTPCPSSPLLGLELLGNTAAAPQILQTLGYKEGSFCVPGEDIPFAMYKPLGDSNIAPPKYFGFAFD